jgi:hypothetical protein
MFGSDQRHTAAEFGAFCKFLLAGRGDKGHSVMLAEQARAPDRVLRLVRSAVEHASTTNEAYAALLDYRQVAEAFVGSLHQHGVFDRLATDRAMVKVPAMTRTAVISIGASGDEVDEGATKPIHELVIEGGQLERRKASCIVIVTTELSRLMAAGAERLISDELRTAVAGKTDEIFIQNILDGAPATASTGTDFDGVVGDIEWLLNAVTLGTASRPYILLSPRRAKRLTAFVGATGYAFSIHPALGGTIGTLPALVSDKFDGEMALVDAGAIAADPGTVLVDASKEANIDVGGSQWVSLFQKNFSALKAERRFAFQRLRADSAAVITAPEQVTA